MVFLPMLLLYYYYTARPWRLWLDQLQILRLVLWAQHSSGFWTESCRHRPRQSVDVLVHHHRSCLLSSKLVKLQTSRFASSAVECQKLTSPLARRKMFLEDILLCFCSKVVLYSGRFMQWRDVLFLFIITLRTWDKAKTNSCYQIIIIVQYWREKSKFSQYLCCFGAQNWHRV